MTISEYKLKFAKIFAELVAEHGKASCVHIEVDDMVYSEDGEPYVNKINVTIEF